MARPEGVEPPTAWFVVFQPKRPILLYFNAFIRLTLSNKIGLFGLICLYSGLFGDIYWTANCPFLLELPTTQAIRHSYGIFRPSCNFRIIVSVRLRFLLNTSDTRPLVPISGSRSLRDKLFCSIKNLIAYIGSEAGIA